MLSHLFQDNFSIASVEIEGIKTNPSFPNKQQNFSVIYLSELKLKWHLILETKKNTNVHLLTVPRNIIPNTA